MPEINPHFSDLVRTDSLTNVGNHVMFLDWLISTHKKEDFKPFTLLSIEMRGLKTLNKKSGKEAGDAALRWAANLITGTTGLPCFRMGNEFITILTKDSIQAQAGLAKEIHDRLNQHAGSVELTSPAAKVIGITFFDAANANPESILAAYYGALFSLIQKPGVSFKLFDSRKMNEPGGFLGYVVYHTISRFTSIGAMLDQSNQLAFIDPISGLPNARAAKIELENAIEAAKQARSHLSILILDGDTLSKYNQFSFSGGDEHIRRQANVLRGEIRPTDYLARWRNGDQFLVILPESLPQQAAQVGERIRAAVETKSKEWMIHSTISVGVAGVPQHGKTADRLIEVAETALGRAKEQGKNRVAIF